MLHALMYVFENFIEANATINFQSKQIEKEMLKAGFDKKEINKALTWFGDLNQIKDTVTQGTLSISAATRIFSDYETNKMTLEARSYLAFLEHSKIVDPTSRELIVDRVMALEEPVIDTSEIKWVTLMVLFSQADKKHELKLMEDLILVHEDSIVH
ncbi:MAG: hypothetical protein A3E87_09580 [Gammaproteobacteria bacterium RIFCSPHIGHO2_12_FULL_35_23]|nr:MAG: hypothetical protein A3E87_09580 [Gammaproteobacteria bacterium RIFCSPHIGHO2_12_FULL_35_23]